MTLSHARQGYVISHLDNPSTVFLHSDSGWYVALGFCERIEDNVILITNDNCNPCVVVPKLQNGLTYMLDLPRYSFHKYDIIRVYSATVL